MTLGWKSMRRGTATCKPFESRFPLIQSLIEPPRPYCHLEATVVVASMKSRMTTTTITTTGMLTTTTGTSEKRGQDASR